MIKVSEILFLKYFRVWGGRSCPLLPRKVYHHVLMPSSASALALIQEREDTESFGLSRDYGSLIRSLYLKLNRHS